MTETFSQLVLVEVTHDLKDLKQNEKKVKTKGQHVFGQIVVFRRVKQEKMMKGERLFEDKTSAIFHYNLVCKCKYYK